MLFASFTWLSTSVIQSLIAITCSQRPETPSSRAVILLCVSPLAFKDPVVDGGVKEGVPNGGKRRRELEALLRWGACAATARQGATVAAVAWKEVSGSSNSSGTTTVAGRSGGVIEAGARTTDRSRSLERVAKGDGANPEASASFSNEESPSRCFPLDWAVRVCTDILRVFAPAAKRLHFTFLSRHRWQAPAVPNITQSAPLRSHLSH